jgi:hypothetical protein
VSWGRSTLSLSPRESHHRAASGRVYLEPVPELVKNEKIEPHEASNIRNSSFGLIPMAAGFRTP